MYMLSITGCLQSSCAWRVESKGPNVGCYIVRSVFRKVAMKYSRCESFGGCIHGSLLRKFGAYSMNSFTMA